jgi:hypothetical protein
LNDGVTQTTPLVMGEVRLASGEPAANVRVVSYVTDTRLLAAGSGAASLETWTDASGHFRLVDPPMGMNTIEAEASADSKAIRMNVPVTVGARLSLEAMTLLPTGAITGQVLAEGAPDQMGTTVFIPGTQYVAITGPNGAYTLNHVPVGTYEVAAMRQTFATTVVVGVTVQPRKTVQAPEIVLSLDAPVLDALSHGNGGAGTEVVLRGRNFGASKNTVLSVSFGATQATTFTRVSDTEIRVTVPQGALSGPVLVRSNGVASNALDFQVIASLSVKPYYAGLYVGDRQKFDVEARDGLGAVVPDPFFAWELGSPFLGTLTEQGELTAREEGWSKILAASGNVQGFAAVGVTPFAIAPARPPGEALSGVIGQLVTRPEGLYFTQVTGNRISFRDSAGIQHVLAGTGERGFSPDGTPALEAKLYFPDGLARDARGNLYFSEKGHHLVRVIPRYDTTFAGRAMKAGMLYTLAGTGAAGSNGDGGPAWEASLNAPAALELGANGGLLLGGSLLIMDSQNRRIREVANDGTIATVLGGGGQAVTAEGVGALAYGGNVGSWLGRDEAGNLVFSNYSQLLFHCRVAGTYFGRAMTAGRIYPVAGKTVTGFDGDGPGLAVRLWSPRNMAFDRGGNVYFLEDGTGGIRVLRADGNVRWVGGMMLPTDSRSTTSFTEGDPATSMKLAPKCLGIRADGSLVVGDDLGLRFHDLSWRLSGAGYPQ